MVNVRRIVGEITSARSPAVAFAIGAELQIGRPIDHHRRITDRPGAEEKLLEQAFGASPHRADAEAVGEHLGAGAGGAVIDREAVAHTFEDAFGGFRFETLRRFFIDFTIDVLLGVEIVEGLDGATFVVKNDGEFAERDRRIGANAGVAGGLAGLGRALVTLAGELRLEFGVASVDDGGQVRMQDLLAGAENAQPVVVENRMAIAGEAGGGGVELVFADLAAVPHRAFRLDVDRAKEAGENRAAVAVAAGGRSRAIGEKRAFVPRQVGINGGPSRRHQARGVGADVGAVVADAVGRLEAIGVEAGHSFAGLLAAAAREGFGLSLTAFGVLGPLHLEAIAKVGAVEVVGEFHPQALAAIDPQDQRPRSFVGTQDHFSRAETFSKTRRPAAADRLRIEHPQIVH